MSPRNEHKITCENAAKAVGLKSQEGLANSSCNALRDSLTAKAIVLMNESQSPCNDPLRPLYTHVVENDFVEQIVTSQRSRRLQQTASIVQETDQPEYDFAARFTFIHQPTPASITMDDPEKVLPLFLRHKNRYLRMYERALKLPIRRRKIRKGSTSAGPQIAKRKSRNDPKVPVIATEIALESYPAPVQQCGLLKSRTDEPNARNAPNDSERVLMARTSFPSHTLRNQNYETTQRLRKENWSSPEKLAERPPRQPNFPVTQPARRKLRNDPNAAGIMFEFTHETYPAPTVQTKLQPPKRKLRNDPNTPGTPLGTFHQNRLTPAAPPKPQPPKQNYETTQISRKRHPNSSAKFPPRSSKIAENSLP